MRDFSASELARLFPEVAEVAESAYCETTGVGVGRFEKFVACIGRQFAGVSVQVSPAPALTVKLRHEWPAGMGRSEAERFDTSLLKGLIEGVLRHQPPAMGCEIVTTAVAHSPETTGRAVQVAAVMAFKDVARTLRWSPGRRTVT